MVNIMKSKFSIPSTVSNTNIHNYDLWIIKLIVIKNRICYYANKYYLNKFTSNSIS